MKNASQLRLGLIALVTAAACGHARPTMMDLQLEWKATNDATTIPAGAADAFGGQTLSVALGADSRTDPATVGKNIQDATKPIPVTTKGDVDSFVVSHIGTIFQALSVKVAPTGGSRLLKVDVQDFYVEEENRYNARVTLGITLTDSAGKTLWHGTVHGTSSDWGRTLAEDSYLQSLSNATLDAIADLCKSAEFLAAVKGKS